MLPITVCCLAVVLLFICSSSSVYATFSAKPVRDGNLFGCEVTGINISSLSQEEFDSLHRTLLQCRVVVVRDQKDLTVEDQRRFSQQFGTLHVHLESASHHDGYADVNLVSNLRNAQGNYIGLYGKHVESYHSDLSWAPMPTKMTFLKSVIRSDGCGDTQFADTVSAYSALPEELRTRLEGVTASYSYLKHRTIEADGTVAGLTAAEVQAALRGTVHPVITVHPITGEKNIYSNPSHTMAIHGMDKAESDEVLTFLYDHVAKEDFLYNHVWKDDDFVMWDNRGCPDEKPRKLVRTTVNNDEEPSSSTDAFPDGPIRDPALWNLNLDRVNAVINTEHSSEEL